MKKRSLVIRNRVKQWKPANVKDSSLTQEPRGAHNTMPKPSELGILGFGGYNDPTKDLLAETLLSVAMTTGACLLGLCKGTLTILGLKGCVCVCVYARALLP